METERPLACLLSYGVHVIWSLDVGPLPSPA